MFSPDTFASVSACLMLLEAAVHHSCGSCSDQSGCGVERFSGVVALLTTRPSRSISRALAPVVERSIPSRCVIWSAIINEISHKEAQKAHNALHVCYAF